MRGWRWVKASQTGTRHAAAGADCEDACGARLIDAGTGEVLILAVADGAGSSRLAGIGAQEALGHFLDGASRALRAGTSPPCEAALRRWLGEARAHLAGLAEMSARPLSAFSTTLLVAILADGWAAYVQIGDGAIIVESDVPGAWGWMFAPHKGVYANETTFLTHEAAASLAHVSICEDAPQEIALFTDGLENLLIREGAERRVVDSFFNEMMAPVRGAGEAGEDRDLSKALAVYLAGEAINARTDDDKTLILATRRQVARPAQADGAHTEEVRSS